MGRLPTTIAVALLLAATVGCRAAAPPASGPGVPPPASASGTFLPALRALETAVENGEDALARRILAGIRARDPDRDVLEWIRGYERILDGRDLVRALELRLVGERVEGPGHLGRTRILLVVRHDRDEPLRLELPPATLCRTTTGLSPEGVERSGATRTPIDLLAGLALAPGETRVIDLGTWADGRPGDLAVRERWTLVPRSGHVRTGGEVYPAQDVPAASWEAVRLAPWLPVAPVPPAELARYAGELQITMPALVERTVRIAPERRDEALDLLTPLVDDLSERRVRELVPALRWLARSTEPGGDPTAWRRWLAARARDRAAERDAPRERAELDLPAAEVSAASGSGRAIGARED